MNMKFKKIGLLHFRKSITGTRQQPISEDGALGDIIAKTHVMNNIVNYDCHLHGWRVRQLRRAWDPEIPYWKAPFLRKDNFSLHENGFSVGFGFPEWDALNSDWLGVVGQDCGEFECPRKHR